MHNLKKHAVSPTGRLHLRDANDELLYADTPNGEPDKERPIVANVFGPGSKEYARAQARQNNQLIDRMKKKGKADQTAEQRAQESAQFLADITRSIENLKDEEPETSDRSALLDVYTDVEIGFIADQVAKYTGDWANFSQPSPNN